MGGNSTSTLSINQHAATVVAASIKEEVNASSIGDPLICSTPELLPQEVKGEVPHSFLKSTGKDDEPGTFQRISTGLIEAIFSNNDDIKWLENKRLRRRLTDRIGLSMLFDRGGADSFNFVDPSPGKSSISQVGPDPHLSPRELHQQLCKVVVANVHNHTYVSADGSIALNNESGLLETLATTIHDYIATFQNHKKSSTKTKSPASFVQRSLTALSARRTPGPVATLSDIRGYSHILPLDIIDRLNMPTRCVVDNKPSGKRGSVRCGNEPKSMSAVGALQALKELKEMERPRQFTKITAIIRRIIEVSTCTKTKHQKLANAGLDAVINHFATRQVDHESSLVDDESLALNSWLDLITGMEHDQAKQKDIIIERLTDDPLLSILPTKEVDDAIIFDFEADFKPAYRPSATFSSTQGLSQWTFVPYREWFKTKTDTPINLATKAAMARLPKHYDKIGTVYVYWIPPNFEYVKIGFTAHDPSERVELWNDKCGYKAQRHYLMKEDEGHKGLNSPRIFEYPQRLEELVHAELIDKRYVNVRCNVCGDSHKEWFKIGFDEAKRTINHWANWLENSVPYDKDGTFIFSKPVELSTSQHTAVIKEPTRVGHNRFSASVKQLRRSKRLSAQRS